MNQDQDPGAIEADRREEQARQTGGGTGIARSSANDSAASPPAPGDTPETSAPDAGSPGGMGGAGAHEGTGRPPGGVSPAGSDESDRG